MALEPSMSDLDHAKATIAAQSLLNEMIVNGADDSDAADYKQFCYDIALVSRCYLAVLERDARLVEKWRKDAAVAGHLAALPSNIAPGLERAADQLEGKP
jgi:hypothetical protein